MKHIITLICLIFISTSSLKAEIHSAQNLDEVVSHLKNISPKTLVVVDMDQTLITKADQVLRVCGSEKLIQFYFRLLPRMTWSKMMHYASIAEACSFTLLVDDRWPQVISALQQQTPYVITHASAPSGTLGLIRSFPEYRVEILRLNGLDFAPQGSPLKDLCLFRLNHIPDVLPIFMSGALFSENYAKGESLAALIKAAEWDIDHVIYIDDLYNNLLSVEKEMRKLNLPVTSIHFEEENLFSEFLNEDIAEIQFQHLIQTGRWLTDQKAEEYLNQYGPLDEDDLQIRPEDAIQSNEEDCNEEIWEF